MTPDQWEREYRIEHARVERLTAELLEAQKRLRAAVETCGEPEGCIYPDKCPKGCRRDWKLPAVEECPHYWGEHEFKCRLPAGHGGRHLFGMPENGSVKP